MNKVDIIYASQLDLKTVDKNQLRKLAQYLGLPNNIKDKDLGWVIAVTLLPQYAKAQMPPAINYGKYTNQRDTINKIYDNLIDRLEVFLTEAGIGGREDRAFNAEELIQYAIDNNIWDRTIEDIYIHRVQSKEAEAEEILQPTFPASMSGKQCTERCKKDSQGKCTCETVPYRGWGGIYNWDYCEPKMCASKVINV